ncbi:NAD(P)-dependent alcohol dehydrogenase [Streptosporangium carneum]|uniref:Alcohol dehydrogenase n=1 Tax=Streptosporangium carneum TaxID=47481 RepID=A0A9W6HUQ9_9ACTN|nr:NAD(P)-dependent alcohol dehydrogenase [Streptosporangium carneum]GLK06691.1 alcohol dehydrogenase [Streptosporangium carneum]
MKAMVFTRYGSPDVLALQEVTKPAPGDDDVLIKVRATSVTSAECTMRRGKPLWGRVILGLSRPRKRMRTLGLEVAGEIESVGRNVRRFRRGDQVFGFTGFTLGACAEYARLPEKGSLALKPVNLTYEEAAAVVDGASTALFFLRDKANVQRGQKVLVNGASGSIGTYAVQLAKHFGAEVTGVCGTGNLELVRSLGADKVIDYTREDFTLGGETYDVIFDTVTKSSFFRCRGALKDDGCYLPTAGLMNNVLMLWTSMTGGRRVMTGMSVEKNEALSFLRELVEAGSLKVVIDRRYRLEQAADAHRYVEAGHKIGNVVITLE